MADSNAPRLTLGAVNIACDDVTRMAEFWAAACGGTFSGITEGMAYLAPAPGGVAFFLMPLDGPRPGSGVTHLDLTVTPGTREAEVERLVALGAERRWDVIGEVAWVDWTTMADPEGNLFCVAEHH